MFHKKQASPAPADAGETTGERRRIARIVHDERGEASVKWEDATPGHRRPAFSVESSAPTGREVRRDRGLELLSIAPEDTFNPYDRRPTERTERAPRRDLRKLSEWIKMMRELEERKRRGEDD
jgi:hypothetical protein